MRYKEGQTIQTVYNTKRKITHVYDADNKYYCIGQGYYVDSEIDHEATAKLTLPQPSKDMLRSGMKVVSRKGEESYCLLEVGWTFDSLTNRCYILGNMKDNLICNHNSKLTIMQIWDGETLIAQRTEKSEAELKKESLEKQIEELSASINVSVKQLDKLKEEIKNL